MDLFDSARLILVQYALRNMPVIPHSGHDDMNGLAWLRHFISKFFPGFFSALHKDMFRFRNVFPHEPRSFREFMLRGFVLKKF